RAVDRRGGARARHELGRPRARGATGGRARMSQTITYREGIVRAMADAMEEDESVFLFGEDVAEAGGPFKLSEGLLERFGPRRVRDTPISEQAIIGTAIGASLSGLRP